LVEIIGANRGFVFDGNINQEFGSVGNWYRAPWYGRFGPVGGKRGDICWEAAKKGFWLLEGLIGVQARLVDDFDEKARECDLWWMF
jgi:hypothetical protein